MQKKKPTRRSFLQSSTALTLGASALAMGACSKIKRKEEQHDPLPIIGHGDFKYEVDKMWGVQDRAVVPVDHCHEMIMDKRGRLLMCTTHIKNNIITYDRSGKVLDTWGKEYPGIHGLTYADQGGEEFLYITDTVRHQVYKTKMNGEVLMTLDYPKEIAAYKNAEQFVPTETTIAENGDIYVADGYGLDYVIQYDPDGRYIRHFAGKGEGAEHVANAHGVCIDNRGTEPILLVTSRAKQSFKKFSMDGKYLSTVEVPGCWICRPVIKGDNLYFAVIVTKSWYDYDGMVAILDKNDKIVSLPGGSMPSYSSGVMANPICDGKTFFNPHDVCIDNDENIYVPQWYSGKTYPIKLARV